MSVRVRGVNTVSSSTMTQNSSDQCADVVHRCAVRAWPFLEKTEYSRDPATNRRVRQDKTDKWTKPRVSAPPMHQIVKYLITSSYQTGHRKMLSGWQLSVGAAGRGSAPAGDPSRPLSVTAALNNSSVFAAVCSKRTGKDRHLLLTTNVGRGGET